MDTLPSYRILRNPVYAKALQFSAKFRALEAAEARHRRVLDDDEKDAAKSAMHGAQTAARGAAEAAALAADVAHAAHKRSLFARQQEEVGTRNMSNLLEMATEEEVWHRNLDRRAATTKATIQAARRTTAQRKRAIAASASVVKHREALDTAIKERFRVEAAAAAAAAAQFAAWSASDAKAVADAAEAESTALEFLTSTRRCAAAAKAAKAALAGAAAANAAAHFAFEAVASRHSTDASTATASDAASLRKAHTDCIHKQEAALAVANASAEKAEACEAQQKKNNEAARVARKEGDDQDEAKVAFERGGNGTFIMDFRGIDVRMFTTCTPDPTSRAGSRFRPQSDFSVQMPDVEYVVFDTRPC
jgi:hypothetical protein